MIYFTSDQHFYHANIIKYCNRPFATPAEIEHGTISEISVFAMNHTMLENFNSVVKPGDTVYHLGDFALAHRAVTVFLPQMNGEHHLIAGNHDHVHPTHSKKHEKMQRMKKLYYEAGFKTINLSGEIEIAGRTVLMSHFPFAGEGDHTEKGERFTEWRLKDNGLWLLHGHVHTAWATKGKQINVGVDVNDFKPVSIDYIADIIKKEEKNK